MMRRRLTLLCVVVGLGACRAGTETVVVVSAGDVAIPGQVDKVRIVVTNTLAGTPDLPLCGGSVTGCLSMPLVATLIPGPDHPSDPVTVEVTAYLRDQPVIRDAATFVFQAGRRERLDFVLYQNCIGNLSCPNETPAQSCDVGGDCAPVALTPLGPHPTFDAGGLPDLAGPVDLAAIDARPVDVMAPDLAPVPDLAFSPGFTANACTSADSIAASGPFAAATCAAYCFSVGLACSDGCTTNRGLASFGVEAWAIAADCTSYATSAGQKSCNTDLSQFSEPSVAKYRCCCH